MSESAEIKSNESFINVCISIEGLSAQLYHYYNTIYEDIPEASRFWKKAALEEENHQKQFELALRLENETEFKVSKANLKRVHSAQNKLLKLLTQSRKKKPELLTAVSKSLEMEEFLAGLHASTSLQFREESMQNLFKALSEADHDHIAEMNRYRETLLQMKS